MNPSDVRFGLGCRIAWLLRTDVRGEVPASSPITPEFLAWWAIGGRREYSGMLELDETGKALLFAPIPGEPAWGRFGLCPLLKALLQWRKDLAAEVDVTTEAGLWRAIAWLFGYGLREHRLLDAVDRHTLAALDETPPFLAREAGATGPALTWLMFFVWRSSGLERLFDLRDPVAREHFVAWFFSAAVEERELAPLLAPRWRAWLLQPVALPGASAASVPRLALLRWRAQPKLRHAFDLRTAAGCRGLGLWFEEALRGEPGLRWLGANADTAVEPVAGSAVPAERPFGLNLIGFAYGELGIGEDVRMAAAACDAAGIPHAVVNIDPGKGLRQQDDALTGRVRAEAGLEEQAPYAANLFCLTGFDTARAIVEKGMDLLRWRYNIGWWPWELPVWPRIWQVAFDQVNEVWAATEFTATMYRAATDKPVTLMPMAASVARVKPMSRRELGLPEDAFLFLYVFDFNSYLDRKNPWAAVAAFRQAFPARDKSVRLVLKTMNSRPDEPRWLEFQRLCRTDKRIVLLEHTMERGEVLGLIDACDAYVSLHRSEGFGRTLAEAMLFGKPVVATDFSGNRDFLTEATGFPVRWRKLAVEPGQYPFVERADKAWWAEPDIADAARQMQAARRAATDPRFAARVKAFAEERFSPARAGERMRRMLAER